MPGTAHFVGQKTDVMVWPPDAYGSSSVSRTCSTSCGLALDRAELADRLLLLPALPHALPPPSEGPPVAILAKHTAEALFSTAGTPMVGFLVAFIELVRSSSLYGCRRSGTLLQRMALLVQPVSRFAWDAVGDILTTCAERFRICKTTCMRRKSVG